MSGILHEDVYLLFCYLHILEPVYLCNVQRPRLCNVQLLFSFYPENILKRFIIIRRCYLVDNVVS